MTDGTHVVMGRFNRPPDDKFMERFRQVLMRPAMYVGGEGYNATCLFLQGMALGFQDWQGSFFHSWLNEEFREFLLKRYGVSEADWAKRCSWWEIYPKMLEREGSTVADDKFLYEELLQNVDDFYNILVRMAVETDDGVEDA